MEVETKEGIWGRRVLRHLAWAGLTTFTLGSTASTGRERETIPSSLIKIWVGLKYVVTCRFGPFHANSTKLVRIRMTTPINHTRVRC